MRNLITIIIALYGFTVFATTFSPLTLKRQTLESDSIFYGRVEKKESVVMDDGRIATKVDLELEKWLGLKVEDEAFVSIYYPGGIAGDQVLKVHGAPHFEIGESTVVFTKLQNDMHWVQNLAMGKYSVKKIGNTHILINNLFPENPKIGQIEMNRFFDYVERVKVQKFSSKFKDKYEREIERMVSKKSKNYNNRSIASVSHSNFQNKDGHEIWWGVLFFIILSVFYIYFSKKEE